MTVKKRRPGLIVALVLLLLVLALLAAVYFLVPRADSPEEVSEVLQSMRFSSAPAFVLCKDACFRQIDSDPAAFERVTVMGGVKNVRMRSFPFLRLFYFTDFAPDDTPWADCANADEVRGAVRRFAADGVSAFTLLAPRASVTDLGAGASLLPYLAMGGVFDEPSIVCDPERGTVRVSGLVHTEEPYAAVDDEVSFAAAVEGFCDRGLDTFALAMAPDYYGAYVYDGTTALLAQAASKLSDYKAAADGTRCIVRFTEAEYTDAARFVCYEEEDIVRSIAEAASNGDRDFELFLIDRTLFSTVAANDFARLGELEQLGGLVLSDLSYNADGTRLSYRNAKLVPDAVQLATLEEAAAYLGAQAQTEAEEIYLFCEPEVYDALTEGLFGDGSGLEARIQDLLPQAGIFDSIIGGVGHIVYVRVSQYFPGTRIMHAVQRGDLSALTDRELETLARAEELAAEAMADTDRETSLRIHDALCSLIVYTEDPDTDEDDTAIGAILNGEANCDGYTDAFYLIGTLAGLEVRYQHGDTYDVQRERSVTNAATHLWDLLLLDGTWRMVDVTYDDGDGEDAVSHVWFDIGTDRAARTHMWHVAAASPLLEETDLSARPANEFSVTGDADLAAAIDAAVGAGYPVFRIIYDDPGMAAGYESALDRIVSRLGYDILYIWDPDMRMLAVYR